MKLLYLANIDPFAHVLSLVSKDHVTCSGPFTVHPYVSSIAYGSSPVAGITRSGRKASGELLPIRRLIGVSDMMPALAAYKSRHRPSTCSFAFGILWWAGISSLVNNCGSFTGLLPWRSLITRSLTLTAGTVFWSCIVASVKLMSVPVACYCCWSSSVRKQPLRPILMKSYTVVLLVAESFLPVQLSPGQCSV